MFKKIVPQKNNDVFNYPKISVVIPAFNEQLHIEKTISTIKAQDYKGKIEIIVVDNNSTDKTASIAKASGAKVITELKKGASAARNKGFLNAKGAIIATTDADSFPPLNWLSRIAYEFQQKPHPVMVSGMYKFYDGSSLLNFLTSVFNFPIFVIFGWYSGANMAVDRKKYFEVGGFNTNIPLSEDTDLGQRLKKHGKVKRLSSLKVQTSARRFNNLGIAGGVWNYSYNYAKFKFAQSLGKDTYKVSFTSGSEINNLGIIPKLAINLSVVSILIFAFMGGILEIKPVKASFYKNENRIYTKISKLDTKLDLKITNINTQIQTFSHHETKRIK